MKIQRSDKGKFYSGTSGLVLPFPNKRSFPVEFQDKSRLTYYASLFNSIEINSSFYRIPMASTVKKWAEGVPEDFQFTFKLWRGVTHTKGLTFKVEDVDHFMQAIALADPKKGCLLVQFPPSLTIANVDQVEKLIISIQQADPNSQWKIALEFRNRSWYQEEIYHLLNQYNVGIVLHDMPSSGISVLCTKARFVYLRFHGTQGDYKGGYTDDFLNEYAQYIKAWKDEGLAVYIYFNNTIGDAIINLMTLNSLINEDLVDLI